MLPITLEIPQQFNLFHQSERSALNFELQVVNEGLFPEVRLYYLTNKKKKQLKLNKKSALAKEHVIVLRQSA